MVCIKYFHYIVFTKRMETKILVAVCSGVVFGFVIGQYLIKKYRNRLTSYNPNDISYAEKVLADLESKMIDIEEVTDDKLKEHFEQDNVLLSKQPVPSEETLSGDRENMSFLNGPANTRYWPYYHYTFPYQYTEGGAWPPNMSSRMYNWQPGFATSGWSYWMRPGMSYSRWPRNRWIRNNGSFYFINQGKDRSKDFL